MKITQMISDMSFYHQSDDWDEEIVDYVHDNKEFCIEYEAGDRYHISLFSPEVSKVWVEVVIRPSKKDSNYIVFKSNVYLAFDTENDLLTHILNECGPEVFNHFAELFAILEMPDKIKRK